MKNLFLFFILFASFYKHSLANDHGSTVYAHVNGLVCDFCARGIEKSFSKDMNLKKIDVDLSKGKVLLAYDLEKIISFDEIKKLIVENGQNATGIKIIKL